jgi:hypothetical protein
LNCNIISRQQITTKRTAEHRTQSIRTPHEHAKQQNKESYTQERTQRTVHKKTEYHPRSSHATPNPPPRRLPLAFNSCISLKQLRLPLKQSGISQPSHAQWVLGTLCGAPSPRNLQLQRHSQQTCFVVECTGMWPNGSGSGMSSSIGVFLSWRSCRSDMLRVWCPGSGAPG